MCHGLQIEYPRRHNTHDMHTKMHNSVPQAALPDRRNVQCPIENIRHARRHQNKRPLECTPSFRDASKSHTLSTSPERLLSEPTNVGARNRRTMKGKRRQRHPTRRPANSAAPQNRYKSIGRTTPNAAPHTDAQIDSCPEGNHSILQLRRTPTRRSHMQPSGDFYLQSFNTTPTLYKNRR